MKYTLLAVSAVCLALIGVANANAQVIASSTCPIIRSQLLVAGGPNDPADVSRLQTFLKNSEHLDVNVTGTFDQKTADAVKVFQKKYSDTVLTPWDATRATGEVFITTSKKINELACGQRLTLNASELATINAYKGKVNSGEVMSVGPTAGPITSALNPASTTSVGNENLASANTAYSEAVPSNTSNSSMLGRLWYFLKNLF